MKLTPAPGFLNYLIMVFLMSCFKPSPTGARLPQLVANLLTSFKKLNKDNFLYYFELHSIRIN